MPRNPGKKSDDLIRQEGRTAKAQGKRPNDNPYKGTSQGFLETQREYERRQMAAALWDEGYGVVE